jgi:splicing factor U2AF subunit
LIICDNLGDHIVGNVYVKFTKEEYTGNALKALHGRYYAGKLILPEFSPVVDFRESR